MNKRPPKIILDPLIQWLLYDEQNNLKLLYYPFMNLDPNFIIELNKLNYTRVYYKSKYNKVNRTPRFTWCYGKAQSDVVRYRGLNFKAEEMPNWLQNMADRCREVVKLVKGFDPGYNSCIIGKYIGGDDQIGFHFDTETFLAHHCCVNLTIGQPRDFQFRFNNQTYEIALQNQSFFMFEGLEHALPKRAKISKDAIRYSISFRNMTNDIGIGNSYYYCRGLYGAIDDDMKIKYQQELQLLQCK